MLFKLSELDLVNKKFNSKESKVNHLSYYDNGDQYHKVNSLDKFTLDVEDKYNLARKFKNGGSCIAGGSVCRQVFMLPEADIDVFFWGLDEEDVLELIKILCEDKEIKYSYRTENSISIITNKSLTIQFILTTFETEYDIIENFDLDSSCGLISHDKNCYVSERGKRAYETRSNMLTPGKHKYYNRILKYLKLGFYFIVPNINLKLVRETNELPKYLNNIFKVILIKNHSIETRPHIHVNIDYSNYSINFNDTDRCPEIISNILSTNIKGYIIYNKVKILGHYDVNKLINGKYKKWKIFNDDIFNDLRRSIQMLKIYHINKGEYKNYNYYDKEQFLEIFKQIISEINEKSFPIKVTKIVNKIYDNHASKKYIMDWYDKYYTDEIEQDDIYSSHLRYFENYNEVENNENFDSMPKYNCINHKRINDDLSLFIINNISLVSGKLLLYNFFKGIDMKVDFSFDSIHNIYNIYSIYKNYPEEVYDIYFKYIFNKEDILTSINHYTEIMNLPYGIENFDDEGFDKEEYINFVKVIAKYIHKPKLTYNYNLFNLYNNCNLILGEDYMKSLEKENEINIELKNIKVDVLDDTK